MALWSNHQMSPILLSMLGFAAIILFYLGVELCFQRDLRVIYFTTAKEVWNDLKKQLLNAMVLAPFNFNKKSILLRKIKCQLVPTLLD